MIETIKRYKFALIIITALLIMALLWAIIVWDNSKNIPSRGVFVLEYIEKT